MLCDLTGFYKLTVHTVVCTVTAPDLPQDGGAQLVAGHRPKAALGQNVQDGAAGVLPGLRRAHPPLLNEVGILLVGVAVKHGPCGLYALHLHIVDVQQHRLLGADRAVACDIDEKCMDVAYENAALNGVGRDRYTVRWGDVVTDQALRQELGGPYDVVVANIVADVIKALASTVRPLVKEGGIFLCSGIIDDRAEEVAQCLRDNGWTIAETRSSEGWFSYLCR